MGVHRERVDVGLHRLRRSRSGWRRTKHSEHGHVGRDRTDGRSDHRAVGHVSHHDSHAGATCVHDRCVTRVATDDSGRRRDRASDRNAGQRPLDAWQEESEAAARALMAELDIDVTAQAATFKPNGPFVDVSIGPSTMRFATGGRLVWAIGAIASLTP